MITVDLKTLIGHLDGFCRRSLEGAAGACVSRTNYEVTVEHMLLQMLEEPGSDISQVLRHFEIDPAPLKKALHGMLEGFKAGNAGKPVFSPMLQEWFRDAWLLSTLDHGLMEIRSGVLLRAFLANMARLSAEDFTPFFEGIQPDELRKDYGAIVAKSTEGDAKFARAVGGAASAAGAPGAAPGGEGSALQKYGINFTERAREGAIDPVFGRDREIRQMVDILGRRRKNNPIVVGEAGVGKTAVVEGLALRIVEGDVPQILQGVDLIGLDMGLLQAGAGMKGEFENRLKQVLEEVKSSAKPLIMFIDEAHTLIGAGGQAGGGDAANLLKPALARGELRTVAATTWSEYKKYFEKDAALARRFQLVALDEPGDDDVVTMLRGLRDRYEGPHGVTIRDDALVAAAALGSRYISGRQHPDKGVDLIDTAAARVKIALTTKPATLQDLERSIQTLQRELAAHERDAAGGVDGQEERIAELKEEIATNTEAVKTLTERWLKEKGLAEKVIDLRKRIERASVAGNGDGEAAAASGETAAPEPAPAGGDAAPATEGEEAAPADLDTLRAELSTAIAELREAQGKEPLVPVEVEADVVAQVVADWTGIPIGKMVQDEAAQLLEFEQKLGERIKGQDHVLSIVGEGIRAAKSGLKSPEQPMGVFLFVGPSGVGKTESALGVADLLFGGERFMTTINMSEFMEKHTVSRLIGSPPGYVGYGEGGVLTEAVRQRPYSVVLLDEVEKADPEVMNLFYQVFDKGSLADGEGREVDFKDTIIFMTSNLATDQIMAACENGLPDVDELVSSIRPILSRHFKPALLARMKIVPFYPILGEAMKMIVDLKLGGLARRLDSTHRMALDFDPKVSETIAERCTEVETGARNIDHILSGTLMPRISRELLQQMSVGPLPDRLAVGIGEGGDFSYTFSD